MTYEPIRYDVESIGEREYWFSNEKFPGTYVVVQVDVTNTSQDDDLDDEAYSDLQMLVPNQWHDWKLHEMKESL